jgi:hypothetical protein
LPSGILGGVTDPEQREALERELAASRALVHELETELAALRPVAAELRQELRALRAGLGSTAELNPDEDDWPSGNGSGGDPALWSGSAPPPPLPKPVIVPRLVLEAGFLAAAAAVAALAELSAPWIVAVMAAAWLIVALSEWVAFEKQRRWRLDEVAPLLTETGSREWYVPPVERTALVPPDRSESHTIVSLPPAEDTGVVQAPVSEETGELVAARRHFWQRRRDDDTSVDDVTEA